MKQCHIGDLGSYRSLSDISDFHLVLAQLALYDSTYARFIESSHKYKILDNGALEQAVGTDECSFNNMDYIELAMVLGVNEIVCPDIPFKPKESLTKTIGFLRQMSKYTYTRNLRVMYVPHGNSLEQWWDNFYQIHLQFPDGVVGVPRILVDLCRDENIRIQISQLLKKYYPNVEIHFLGAAYNFISESTKLKALPNLVRSIDSTFIHRYALSGEDPEVTYSPPVFLKNNVIGDRYQSNVERLSLMLK